MRVHRPFATGMAATPVTGTTVTATPVTAIAVTAIAVTATPVTATRATAIAVTAARATATWLAVLGLVVLAAGCTARARPPRDSGAIGSAAHREPARQAVRKSQVLLKNVDDVLPLAKTGGKIFVAGKNADDLRSQSGGRTTAGPGTTILQGIREVAGKGTTITYDRDGAGVDRTYRAAIAVLGESPYANSRPDRPGARLLDAQDRQVLARLKAAGVPTVVVLVSGRPLDIAGYVDDWSALVEAWLPGSEGGGVADVLFGDYAPTGRLPVTWPRSAGPGPVTAGGGKTGLYAYGYGLGYPDRPADGAAPSRPGTPAATAGRLRWMASTDEAGGSGIDGYDVLRDGAVIGVTTSTDYPLGTLTPGLHDFTVVARDKAGNRSAPSTPLEITVPVPGGCRTRPGPCAVT